MSYAVLIESAAAKTLRKMNPPDAQRLRAAIDLLAENPRPPAAIPLKGSAQNDLSELGGCRSGFHEGFHDPVPTHK